MIRIILFLILAYIVYKIMKNTFGILKMQEKIQEKAKEDYYIDENGQVRKVKDITKEAKILKEE